MAVRPQTLGMRWTRPPFSLILYLADQEDRLVGRSPDAFAIIEPPIARSSEWAHLQPARVRRLGRLVRTWQFLMPYAPVLIALIVIALFLRERPLPAIGVFTAGFAITIAEMLVAAGRMSWSLGRFLRTRRTDGEILGDELRSHYWTIEFCHASSRAPTDRLLIEAAERAALTESRLPADVAFGSGIVAVNAACGAGEALSLLDSADAVGDTGWFVIGARERFRRPDQEAVRPLGGIRLILVTTVAFVFATAQGVVWFERQACAGAACAARPVTFPRALGWTLEHVIGRFPRPATWQSQSFGAFVMVVVPLMAACIVVALAQRRRYHLARRRVMYEAIGRMTEEPTVAILAVNEIECQAVIDAFRARNSELTRKIEQVGDHAVHRLGPRVVLAQSEQGTVGAGSMPWTVHNLIEELEPAVLILTGICYGLDSRELDGGVQELGDLVVATQLRPMDHRKIATHLDGSRRETTRGPRPETPSGLLSHARALALGRRPTVHFGPVLSLNTLLNNPAERDRLRILAPEAIAGEMESAGLYAAAAATKHDWILIKGIADWGAGKTDTHQPAAARHAADFVADLIAQIYPGGAR
jgi:nucleoside phosphorylase